MYCCGPHYSGITEAVLLTSFHSCPHISSRYKSTVTQMADRLQGSCRIYPVSPRKLVVEQEIRSMSPRSLFRCYIFRGNTTKLCFPTCPCISCRCKGRASVNSSILVGGGHQARNPSILIQKESDGAQKWFWAQSLRWFIFVLIEFEKKKKKFRLKNKQEFLSLKTY